MYYVCKNSKRLQEELKVGDKVKIISDRKVRSLMSQKYSLMFGFDFDGEMCYRIDLDDQCFIWDSNMFERGRTY